MKCAPDYKLETEYYISPRIVIDIWEYLVLYSTTVADCRNAIVYNSCIIGPRHIS